MHNVRLYARKCTNLTILVTSGSGRPLVKPHTTFTGSLEVIHLLVLDQLYKWLHKHRIYLTHTLNVQLIVHINTQIDSDHAWIRRTFMKSSYSMCSHVDLNVDIIHAFTRLSPITYGIDGEAKHPDQQDGHQQQVLASRSHFYFTRGYLVSPSQVENFWRVRHHLI